MNNQDFSISMLVDQTPPEVFAAINNVRGWWSENIDGDTDRLDSEFLYHYKDVHTCRIMVTGLIPDERVSWKVLDNHFSFTQDPDEWKGDELVFEIRPEGTGTRLIFTQHGLTPAYECFDVCSDAWSGFIRNSLRKLIETGRGEQTPKDADGTFNEELIDKWGLKHAARPSDYTFSFTTIQSPETVFEILRDVRRWWTGLFGEDIQGASRQLGDGFSFHAGEGMHFSRQRVVELKEGRKIFWEVLDSNLCFLQEPHEWTGSRFGFELAEVDGTTRVRFTHKGLVPGIECYDQCSSAWAGYMQQLSAELR